MCGDVEVNALVLEIYHFCEFCTINVWLGFHFERVINFVQF